MTLQLLPSEFPCTVYDENIILFSISVRKPGIGEDCGVDGTQKDKKIPTKPIVA
jgi:hypothetical protein